MLIDQSPEWDPTHVVLLWKLKLRSGEKLLKVLNQPTPTKVMWENNPPEYQFFSLVAL